MLDRRIFISIIGIAVVLGIAYVVVQKVIEDAKKQEEKERSERAGGDDDAHRTSCPGDLVRENPPYGDCVCPKGTGGIDCRTNTICNARAPVGNGYDPDTETCHCIGMFQPYGHNFCKCPEDDVNGVDMDLGFKENCCGAHGRMRKNTSSCDCDDGWYGANCNLPKYILEGCNQSACSNNINSALVECRDYGASICSFRTGENHNGSFELCYKTDGEVLQCERATDDP